MIRALILIILVGASAFAQSGRRNLPPPIPTPTPEAKPSLTSSLPPGSQVTAEKDEDYRCTVRRLPYGLTENAIRVACEIKARPAMNGGQPVSQWVTVEYGFRLADSSIFGP